jgi:hypothetical protein
MADHGEPPVTGGAGSNRAAIVALDERAGPDGVELAAASAIAHATVSTTVVCLVRRGAVERIEVAGGGGGLPSAGDRRERGRALTPAKTDTPPAVHPLPGVAGAQQTEAESTNLR